MGSSAMASEFENFKKKINSPALLAIAQYWDKLRGNNVMPSWHSLNPAEIAPYLSRIWSFKYNRDNGCFIGRLAGNRITMGLGKNFRGLPLEELHAPQVYEKVHAYLLRSVEEPGIYRSSGALFKVGERVIKGERIVLPLASDGIHADEVLGASDYGPCIRVPSEAIEMMIDNVDWCSLSCE